ANVGLLLAQSPVDDASGNELAITQVLERDSQRPALQEYRKLFNRFGKEGVRLLKHNAHAGVALQAAWEDVRTAPLSRQFRSVTPDPKRLTWFLGFVEGRLALDVPVWWKTTLLNAGSGEISSVKRLRYGRKRVLQELSYYSFGAAMKDSF